VLHEAEEVRPRWGQWPADVVLAESVELPHQGLASALEIVLKNALEILTHLGPDLLVDADRVS